MSVYTPEGRLLENEKTVEIAFEAVETAFNEMIKISSELSDLQDRLDKQRFKLGAARQVLGLTKIRNESHA